MSDALAAYVLELEAKGRSSKTIVNQRNVIRRWLRSGECDPVKYLTGLKGLAPKSRVLYRETLALYVDWCITHGRMSGNGLRPSAPARQGHPLDTALTTFQLELAATGHSVHTVREYGRTVRRWQASGLDPQMYLMSRDLKPGTRTMWGIVLRRFLAWAAARGLGENPLAAVKFKVPPANLIRPFNEEEIDALLNACRKPLQRAVIIALLETGLRASELANIRYETDIDRSRATVAIQRGKGGKSRRVALAPETIWAIEVVTANVMTYQQIYRIVSVVGKRAALGDVHPHRFRHTFSHNFLAAGGDRGDLRVLLGHSSYIMVDRYAAYWEEERALQAHRRFMAARDAGQKAVVCLPALG